MTDRSQDTFAKCTATTLLTPGPLGAISLTICAIVAMVTGVQDAGAVSVLLFFWVVIWGIARAVKS